MVSVAGVVASTVAVKSEVRERPRVLFLYGQAVVPDSMIGRFVGEAARLFEVRTVATGEWRRRDFAAEVNRVDALLAESAVAVGQSYDAWLLMAAAEQRSGRGDALPFLLLLNPVLGAAQHLNGSLLGYRAPRSRRVRAAFGLDPAEDGRKALMRRVTYVFGDNDPFSSQADWSYLRGLGCPVHVVRGWHHLHRRDVEQRLREILADYAHDTAAMIAAETAPAVDVAEDAPGRVCAAGS
jgi:hypothetical protein